MVEVTEVADVEVLVDYVVTPGTANFAVFKDYDKAMEYRALLIIAGYMATIEGVDPWEANRSWGLVGGKEYLEFKWAVGPGHEEPVEHPSV